MKARIPVSTHVLYDPIHNSVVTIEAACRLHAEQILANRLGYGWVRLKGSRPKFVTIPQNYYKALYQHAFDYEDNDR